MKSCLQKLCYFTVLFNFRLHASEDVQYFQFDKFGNMYVYKPGSGFLGPSLKVEPGFMMQEVVDMMQNLSLISDVTETQSEVKTECVEISQESSVISSNNNEIVSATSIKRYYFVVCNRLCL